MFRHAFQHRHLAAAAHPFQAGMAHVHAGREQGVEDGGAGRHRHVAAGLRQMDRECALCRRRRGVGAEVLQMDEARVAARGGRFEGPQHAGGTAAIEMRIRRRRGYDGREVQHPRARLVVEIDVHAPPRVRRQLLQPVQQRGMLAGPRAVVELPRTAQALELLDHGPQRRNAYAPGDHDRMPGPFVQGKVVARRADRQAVADLQGFVHVARSASAGGILVHGDDIASALGIVVEQGIAAHHAVPQVDVDMGARGEGRQLRAALVRRRPQFVRKNALRFVANGADVHVKAGAHGTGPRIRRRSRSTARGAFPW